jgi:hypothetical protein
MLLLVENTTITNDETPDFAEVTSHDETSVCVSIGGSSLSGVFDLPNDVAAKLHADLSALFEAEPAAPVA